MTRKGEIEKGEYCIKNGVNCLKIASFYIYPSARGGKEVIESLFIHRMQNAAHSS